MPGRQQTFDLIPTSLVRPAGSKPPMTSKAAKKAYLKANQGPRISRAEQRRLEAVERAQQREEDEKERNARRAKAARERKSQKELAQREARKKMGLPEPSKFVRASQPTISRFVVAGAKRSWQEMETLAEESDGTIYENEDGKYPPAKPVAVDVGDVSEEEFGDFPSLSQSDLPALLDRIETPTRPVKEIEGASQVLPQLKAFADKEDCNTDDEQIVDEMITAQLLSEATEASSRPSDVPPPRRLSSRSDGIPIVVDNENIEPADMVDSTRKMRNGKARQALKERPVNIPPPVKVAKTISFAPTPPKPIHSSLAVYEVNDTPSATQVFLENNLDDFFPSPSQEIRELLEDADDLPSNTQITRELNPANAVGDGDLIAGMFLTQDFTLSSQDIREINTPSRAPPGRDGNSVPAPSQVARKEKGRFFEEKEEDLLQAAIHESKLTAEREKEQEEPVNKAPRPAKRTLQRVQSTTTDYGDEEFSAFEQDFLALL